MKTITSDFISAIDDLHLKHGITEYIRLWQSGLKKQANSSIRDTMQYFDTLDKTVQRNFEDSLCKSAEKSKTAVRLPYEISVRLSASLKQSADNNEMPRSRWYCMLFCTGSQMIKDIYYKHPDDHAIAEMYFSSLLSDLDFGAHHFPDGCCISKSCYHECVLECEKLISTHSFSDALLSEYQYLISLYTAYYSWDRICDFSELCKKHGIKFTAIPAYYYTK